jgi:RNA polymerase sigma-70 factor (ECF subfamily)
MDEGHTAERLLVAVARQDGDAFKRLYDLASPKLFAITLRICRDRSLAEDALQDTFTAVWRRASAFDPKRGNGMVWLSAVARNRSIDLLRRRTKDARMQTGVYQEDAMRLPDLESARADYAELDALITCLGELDESQRQTLLLAYYEGWTREELGKRFETPVNTIKTRLRRGLAKLRGCLERAA